MSRNYALAMIVLSCGAAVTPRAAAHETDQYSVPLGREYADLNGYFSDALRDTLERAVLTLNGQIAGTLVNGRPTAATARLQSPEVVMRTVYHAMPLWVTWVEPLEGRLLSPEIRNRYPGLLTVYHPPAWIYHHPALLVDPTKLPRLVRCGTLAVGGVEFGTDKMMHFAHMGSHYASTYFRARAGGKSESEAMQAAVALGTGANPFLSEATWLGYVTTGVWSNSDLAVNYVGLKFFRNLTETVSIAGVNQPPLLERNGEFWRVGERARPGREFFGEYVTDHWNEVYNLNLYVPTMPPFVRAEIRKRCDDALRWHVDRHGEAISHEWLLERMTELTTYFGEDYGHDGEPAEMIGLATVCHLPQMPDANPQDEAQPKSDASDRQGRTRLWWAAADADVALVEALLADGADPNAADIDGETALHAAARAGSAAVVTRLVDQGARTDARALYGATALHRAARADHVETVSALLAAGAPADAADDFGCTPLEDAALHGHEAIVQLLLDAGADPARATRLHRTLGERVRRAGFKKLAEKLAVPKADPE